MINGVRKHDGRCNMTGCGKQAEFAQLLGSGRQFLYCDEHASKALKDAILKREKAEAEEKAKQSAKRSM
jgi:hypothetical protein